LRGDAGTCLRNPFGFNQACRSSAGTVIAFLPAELRVAEANMIRSILVPLDGSPFGERALPIAASLARGSKAVLHVVRVHVPHTRPPLSLEGMPVTDPEKDSARWEAERAYVRRIRKRMGARSEVAMRSAVLNGPVAEMLATYAAFNRVDLVVMSTHGRGGLARAWMGSVGDALLRRSPVPVLLVRPAHDVEPAAVPDGPPRILIALDGSNLSELIVDHAVSLGRPLGAAYTLLRVVDPVGALGDLPAIVAPRMGRAMVAQHVAEAEDYLAGIARELKDRGLDVRAKVIESERAAETILSSACHGASFVAMATHGRSGLSRLLLGSVAGKVLQAAGVPVLLCRPGPHNRGLRARPEEIAAAQG
jgi:nucleotide-binding universal stress UspA family protein